MRIILYLYIAVNRSSVCNKLEIFVLYECIYIIFEFVSFLLKMEIIEFLVF